MTDIRGRTAVVTGGGSGIGKGLAKALAAEGAKVAVADIILANAQQVVDEIGAAGGTAIAVACDVCERDAIEQMKKEVNAALGSVTLFVANAGATSFERITEMSNADIDWILQVNLMGATYSLHAFVPDMIAAREGQKRRLSTPVRWPRSHLRAPGGNRRGSSPVYPAQIRLTWSLDAKSQNDGDPEGRSLVADRGGLGVSALWPAVLRGDGV